MTTRTTAAGGVPSYNVIMTMTMAAAPEEAGGGDDVMTAAGSMATMTRDDDVMDHHAVGGRISKALMSDDELFKCVKLPQTDYGENKATKEKIESVEFGDGKADS